MDFEAAFEQAFIDPRYTATSFPPSDVNSVIESNYEVDSPFVYTRSQLWDMEVKKAHEPETYLYQLVRPGSVLQLDKHQDKHLEYFVRISDQKTWKNTSIFTRVIERVCLDHTSRRAFFLGEESLELPGGTRILAGKEQPIFYVEHSVAGTEDAPLNIWRIVLLTDQKDESVISVFKDMAESKYLREFNEVYIRRDLKHKLVRR